MEKSNDQAALITQRLQEREKEQMLILSICKALSEVLTTAEFHNVINDIVKHHFSFEDFILASSKEDETEYQVFYQFTAQKKLSNAIYSTNDGFFDVCLNTADTVVFDIKSLTETKNALPAYLLNAKDFKNGIGVCLPNHRNDHNVLFLFFKNAAGFSREANRILRGIATQLSITVGNIKMAEAYQNSLAELSSLKRNFDENQIPNVKLESSGFHGIIGNSAAMQEVYELIGHVAPSQSTVLICGETGTGKELVAKAIHTLSRVSNEKMVKVNCASIPENLIESELFGHEKGAFTGALDSRIGKFEQADNGTIFLDEIGELPLELQGKLLRVLQEKEIERIGGQTTKKINVRVIAATNRSLEKEVADGRFRSDLFYRLNVFPILLPALRERSADIEILSQFFLEKHSAKMGKNITGFSKKVINSMNANSWQGNVRELENMVERAVLFANEKVIKEMIFPEFFKPDSKHTETEFYTKTLQEVEKEHILKVVEKCGGRISGPQGAAILLGVPATTLISRMQKLGIKKKHF